MAVAQVHFCSFFLTASIDERIPLLQYTGTLRNEGAPGVSFTPGGLNPKLWQSIQPADKNREQQNQKLTLKRIVWDT